MSFQRTYVEDGSNRAAAAEAAQAQTPHVQTDFFYTVQSGDTLRGLAVTYGTTPEAIIEANDLAYPYSLSVGESLLIPDGSSPAHSPREALAQLISNLDIQQTRLGARGESNGCGARLSLRSRAERRYLDCAAGACARDCDRPVACRRLRLDIAQAQAFRARRVRGSEDRFQLDAAQSSRSDTHHARRGHGRVQLDAAQCLGDGKRRAGSLRVEPFRPAERVVAATDKHSQAAFTGQLGVRRCEREPMPAQPLGAAAKLIHGFGCGGKASQHHGVDVVAGGLGAVGANHIVALDAESQRLLDATGSPEDAGKRAVEIKRQTTEMRPVCVPRTPFVLLT